MATVCISTKDGDQLFTIVSQEAEEHMNHEDLIYPCGSDEHPGHEYHLNPEKDFSMVDVEQLLLNLRKA